jgi:hypothetical protein
MQHFAVAVHCSFKEDLIANQQSSRAEGIMQKRWVPQLSILLILTFMASWPATTLGADQNEALYVAASQGDLEGVRQLLDSGVPVDAKNTAGWTALMKASMEGHQPVVQELIQRGADVNIQGRAGWTALMQAAQFGHLEIVKILLDRGAELNGQSVNGSTGLMFAATNGHLETVRYLLEQRRRYQSPG